MKVISTDKAPAAIGPYVQALDLGNLILLSGQIPLNAAGEMAVGIVNQTRQALENVKAILLEGNLAVSNIVKTTVVVSDLNDVAAVNAEYEKFFTENSHPFFPVRSCVEVARLPRDVGIEIEVMAVRP